MPAEQAAALAPVRVQFLGTGGPLASGGRLQSGILIQSARGCYLVDCGMTALVSMSRFDIDPGAIDAVLITHLHGDHYGGLPLISWRRASMRMKVRRIHRARARCSSLVLPKPRRACAKCSTYSAGALNSPR